MGGGEGEKARKEGERKEWTESQVVRKMQGKLGRPWSSSLLVTYAASINVSLSKNDSPLCTALAEAGLGVLLSV